MGTVKTEFWLLDLNYELYGGNPTIWLWGITQQQERVLLIDSCEPYFYMLSPDGQKPEQIQKQLEQEKPHPSISRIMIERKRDLSTEKQVLKIFCKDSESLEKCARATAKSVTGSKPYEHDLRLATKYQNDHEIRPCQWYTVEAEKADLQPAEYSVDKTLTATTHPVAGVRTDPPELRALGFSLLTVSPAGSPNPARDPIRIISWRRTDGKHAMLEASGDSDENLLDGFTQIIVDYNPDVLFSFGGNDHHWSYLTRRAEKTKKTLQIGRGHVAPHRSLYGHISITGRANVDLADFAEDLYDVKEKTLGNVAKYLGLRSDIDAIDETEYYNRWKNASDRPKLVANVAAETSTLLELGNDALPYVLQLSWLSALPLDQVLRAAVGFRVDSYMMMEAKKLGLLIPARTEQPIIPYKGAIVLEPRPGLFENVAALDFVSMYPSLMIKYNISPDTLVQNASSKEVFTLPEVGHKFRKDSEGFYPIVLKKLIENRKSAKRQLTQLQKGTIAYRLLKAREHATKIITNAVYGYAGWAGSRWYSRQVAESAAALGRKTITESVSIAKALGLKVLYGDTDSLFLENDETRVKEFLQTIETQLGLEINVGQVYKRILLTESKKKYAGLKPNGELDIIGMEAIRGDWSGLAKEVQNQVLRMVLEDKSPVRATSYVANLAKDLRGSKLPLSSFVIWKSLTKRPEDYDIHAPHVEVAKKLAKAGWPVGSGDRVSYVIVKGPGRLYQRAEPYSKVSLDNVDYDYYVENQVLPVAGRILSVFGVSEQEIVPGQKNAGAGAALARREGR